MIIDMHVHMFEEKMWPKQLLDKFLEHKRRILTEEEYKSYKMEARTETLIKEMDEAGVDVSVCLPIDFAFMCHQEPEISIWKANEYVAEAQGKYPDRIVGFVGVDPQRPNAVEILERGIKELGLKGVKIFPGNFYPSEERIATFIQKIEELNVPVLFHLGTDDHPFALKYGDPRYIDDLALKYPRLKIIAAHLARGYEELLIKWMVYLPDRVWADISGWQYEYVYSKWYFLMQIRYVLDRIPNAIVMGSDWPFLKTVPFPSEKEWVEALKNLSLPKAFLDMGMKQFTEEEKIKVLGTNAKRLLNL
jgi:predicted TIM-barrel fold metal-dependent hydrolase